MLKESSDDHDHDDTPACTPTPPMLRLYVTQVDDNGNDAISIDEWLEFWRNVLAQVTLASPQASHQPKVTLTHPRARDTRPWCSVAWLPSYDLCTCYPRRIATRQRT